MGPLVVPVPRQSGVGAARAARASRPRARGARGDVQDVERPCRGPGSTGPRDRAPLARSDRLHTIRSRMIYCVIPRELADELYDKMVEYYKGNPNVTVIIE